MRAVCLTSQTGLLSAIANDTAGDMGMAQQLHGYGRPGDLFWALSTSGRTHATSSWRPSSPGPRASASWPSRAQRGRRLGELADVWIAGSGHRRGPCQELHQPLYHALCAPRSRSATGRTPGERLAPSGTFGPMPGSTRPGSILQVGPDPACEEASGQHPDALEYPARSVVRRAGRCVQDVGDVSGTPRGDPRSPAGRVPRPAGPVGLWQVDRPALIAGLEAPTAGTVRIGGDAMTGSSRRTVTWPWCSRAMPSTPTSASARTSSSRSGLARGLRATTSGHRAPGGRRASASTGSSGESPQRSRAASATAWPWPARWSADQRSSSWTNPLEPRR